MKKIKNFRKAIKDKRSELREAGYTMPTINSWIYTDRLPRFETAIKLSNIIGLKLNEIPFFRIERG
jgi:hypothetical protein